MTTKKIVYVDIDSVSIDLMAGWIPWYNEKFDDNKELKDFKFYDVTKVVKKECGTQIYDYLHDPTIYSDLPAIPGAVKGVKAIRDMGHQIVYATFGPIQTAGVKYYALVRLGLFDDEKDIYMEFKSKKGLTKRYLNGDILLDDNPENCSAFEGIGYLYTQPWNEVVGFWPYRVNNWVEFVQKVRELDD